MSLRNNGIFKAVQEHADHMLAYGRGCKKDPEIPLFGAVVCAMDREVKTHQVVPPPGIRINDFSWAGNNLMHDVPFLETLIALTALTGDKQYEEAVDRVFAFYPRHCPHPVTGLFPWGEHAQWSFASRRILANACHDPYVFVKGNQLIHEHLRFAPAWFWERMWRTGPDAVVNFAKGLDWHIMNHDTFEHNRHAPMDGEHWNEIPYKGKGKDFARHAGMFIFDCLFAYRKSGRQDLLDWARRKLRYHLDRRHPNGIVKDCIRTEEEHGEGQHDSLACSVFDAAEMLGRDTPEGREFMAVARELFDARLRRIAAEPAGPVGDPLLENAWNSGGYGAKGASFGAGGMTAMLHARTGAQVFADRIVQAADRQMGVQPPGTDWPVVTSAFTTNLQLPLDAYALTGAAKYLERALTVARWAIERAAPTGLFLGVINMDYIANINILYSVGGGSGNRSPRPGYYFSGTGAPTLVRNLLRLAMLQEGEPDILGVDPHAR